MCTLTPTFVKIYVKTTNLYRFTHENPNFAVLCNVNTVTVPPGIRYYTHLNLSRMIINDIIANYVISSHTEYKRSFRLDLTLLLLVLLVLLVLVLLLCMCV